MAKVLVNLDPMTGNKWRVNVDGEITVVSNVVWMGVTAGTEAIDIPDREGKFYCVVAYNVRTVHGIQDDVMLILPKND